MKCFVIMPFAPEFDDVYHTIKVAVETSVPGEQVTCQRLDEIKSAGRITDDLIRELRESIACVADFTGCKPNVMWEVGYAMALQKPTLFLTQDLESVPFDIKDMRTIGYQRQSLVQTLQRPLSEAFRHTLGRYEVRTESRRIALPSRRSYTIALTGSMEADREKLRRRLDAMLHPYLSADTTWMVGANGEADEAAIEYLAQNEQKVVAVGYHAYDVSPQALNLIEKLGISFLDARKEQLPKDIQAPSERDLLFLTKADLLIVFWSGRSSGIKSLIDWYSRNEKDHIIAFV
jgi:hypothetical protein